MNAPPSPRRRCGDRRAPDVSGSTSRRNARRSSRQRQGDALRSDGRIAAARSGEQFPRGLLDLRIPRNDTAIGSEQQIACAEDAMTARFAWTMRPEGSTRQIAVLRLSSVSAKVTTSLDPASIGLPTSTARRMYGRIAFVAEIRRTSPRCSPIYPAQPSRNPQCPAAEPTPCRASSPGIRYTASDPRTAIGCPISAK